MYLPLELLLEFFSCLWSQPLLSTEELPRFFLLVLEALSLLRTFSPVLSTSSLLKLHVLELELHRGFVLVR